MSSKNMLRFKTRNNYAGPGFYVVDTKTGREIAWVYDQVKGWEHPEIDKLRAELFSEALNQLESKKIKSKGI